MNNQQKTENIENILSNNSEEMPTQYNNRMENQVPGESDIKRASEIDDEDEDSKRRNRRRSKNDNDGRSHKCQMCGKAYLSYPALYTHIKTKHDMQGAGSGKGRGRPKKDIGVAVNSIKLLYNPATTDFFKHPDRAGETQNIRECMFSVFEDMYHRLRSVADQSKIKECPSIGVHPFFLKLEEILQIHQNSIQNANPNTSTCPDENAKCDEVFAFYVFKMAKYAKPEYFIRVMKFVLLFRECLNILYKDKAKAKSNEVSYEYSEIFNTEDAPDISNDFVTEYLCTDSCMFDFSREEAIDLTQNFCQWLYDNNYTCSKLSLISNV